MEGRRRGFTLIEILTALIVITVLTAVAIPMWRAHVLRVRRADARDSLIALQAAQDHYFGRNARYAGAALLTAKAPDGLELRATSQQGLYAITLTTAADGLSYLATAKAMAREGQEDDSRCAEFSIDHSGQMRAVDPSGVDRSADCWH